MPENARKDDLFVPDFVKEAEEQIAKGVKLPTMEEVTIKFGKGLAEPFQSKDGREFMRISIPNQDPSDKTPCASFVLPARQSMKTSTARASGPRSLQTNPLRFPSRRLWGRMKPGRTSGRM